jgi:hypothetical protein
VGASNRRAPPDVARLVRELGKRGGVPAELLGGPIPQGRRNAGLFQLGCRLLRLGCGAAELRPALARANRHRFQPPLPEQEVEQIVTSILKYPAPPPWRSTRSTSPPTTTGSARTSGSY